LNTLIEQFRADASSAVPVQKVAVAAKKSVEQFAQMVVKRDDNAIEYAPAQEGAAVDVAYMLPTPTSGDNKAYTLLRLEEAWKSLAAVVGVDVLARSPAVMLAEGCGDCFASMEAVLKAQPKAIVACGTKAREQWMQFVQQAACVDRFSMVDEQAERVARMTVVSCGRSITVFFAPHPSCTWLNGSMALAMAEAHEVLVPATAAANKLAAHMQSYASLTSVKTAPRAPYVTFAVDAADHRFVLSDGSITHNSFKFPQIKPHPWAKVFRNKAPANAIDLVSKWLRYEPKSRLDPFESLAHPFFDELRENGAKMPNQQPVPDKLFQFTENELKVMHAKGLTRKLIPPHLLKNYKLSA